MPRRIRVTMIAFIALCVVCGLTRADARHRSAGTGLAPIAYDRVAPNFAFDSERIASLAALRGRPIVLNFWASYCEPCVDELAAFAKLRERYGPDVAFVTISDQPREITDDALRAKGIESIAVADPDRKIFALYGVSAIPVTLVLSPAEAVKYVSVGELDWAELQAAVDAVRAPHDLTPGTARDTLRLNAGTPLL